MIKTFKEFEKDYEGLQYIRELKELDSKKGKSIVNKIIDVVKKSVKLKKKEEDYLSKHFYNKYLDNDKDKKLSNAWLLIITKEYMSTNPGIRYPLYYYVVDEEDSIEKNKAKASEIYHSFPDKYDNIGIYQIHAKNTEFDKEETDTSKNGAWQVVSYEYELNSCCCPEALRHLIDKAKDSSYTKDNNIKVNPKKVDSIDELVKVMDKIKKLYYDKEKETEDFLNTPLDKIDDFVFKIKPSDADID
jgi:parvulin-like peptidyl-prolyl isomerase